MGEDDGRTVKADAATDGTDAAKRRERTGNTDATAREDVARSGEKPEVRAEEGTGGRAVGEEKPGGASGRGASTATPSGTPSDARSAREDEAVPASGPDAAPATEDASPGGAAGTGAADGKADDREAEDGESDDGEAAAKGRETGRLLAGRYRLGGVQGRGGMGTVWRARDEVLGRTVAVKELRFPSDIDEDEKRRLITRTLREAKAIARIRSGSAVTVFDVVDEDDRPWIVMELVEGRSLAEVIREDGPVPPRRAAEIGLAVLGVLRAAHREGIVHRDVKPSNVLIEQDTGRVVLTDFGIAKVEGDPSVTSTGMLVGAPSYISPERARGQRPGPPADMWSLGGLLYAAVEGTPPYDKGSAIATLTAVMTDPLEPPRNASELEEVIYGLLIKDPAKRLDDAGARVLLQAVLDAPADSELAATSTATRTVAMPEPSSGTARPKGGPARQDQRSRTTTAPTGRGEPKRRTLAAFGSMSGGRGAQGGPDGEGADGRPSGVMVAAIAIVVLGVLGAVLAFTLNSGDGDEQDPPGSSDTADSGGTGEDEGDGAEKPGNGDQADRGKSADGAGAEGADASGAEDGGSDGGEDAKGEDGDAAARGGGDDGGEDGADAAPEGYATVTDEQFRFAMALPEGWERVRIAGQNSGGVYAAESGAAPSVQVDYTNAPGDDAVAAWEQLERAVKGTFPQYERVGLEEVAWRDYPTVADWSYEYTRDGERMRALNRGFRVDGGRGHAILVTCQADEWDGKECRTLRETAFDTFEPVDP
ncbi:serine/threonine-protein kinase [Streptomyces sp. GSL17-111]|uniref:serine/threonine-protein kinase n=1 Tax=Streptomyces sp. GSL17-111 TaxID=3121596 RepID=UPI0030F3F339